jgi:hypothetical protein
MVAKPSVKITARHAASDLMVGWVYVVRAGLEGLNLVSPAG